MCQIFSALFEDNIISSETFTAWSGNKDPAEQAGKSVALMSLTQFFTSLGEADDDSCEESWTRPRVVPGISVREKDLWACDAPYTALCGSLFCSVCASPCSLNFAAQVNDLSSTQTILSEEPWSWRSIKIIKVVYNNIILLLAIYIYSVVFVERVTAVSPWYLNFSVCESAYEIEARFCTVWTKLGSWK